MSRRRNNQFPSPAQRSRKRARLTTDLEECIMIDEFLLPCKCVTSEGAVLPKIGEPLTLKRPIGFTTGNPSFLGYQVCTVASDVFVGWIENTCTELIDDCFGMIKVTLTRPAKTAVGLGSSSRSNSDLLLLESQFSIKKAYAYALNDTRSKLKALRVISEDAQSLALARQFSEEEARVARSTTIPTSTCSSSSYATSSTHNSSAHPSIHRSSVHEHVRRNNKRKLSSGNLDISSMRIASSLSPQRGRKKNPVDENIVDLCNDTDSPPDEKESKLSNVVQDINFQDRIYENQQIFPTRSNKRQKRTIVDEDDTDVDLQKIIEDSRKSEKYAINRRLRAEQDADMELSRAMDLSKEACIHEKKRLEEKRIQEEAQHQAALSAVHQKISERKQKMLETLTPEPDINNPSAYDICVSLTTGKRIRRRFHCDISIHEILDWSEGHDDGEEAISAPEGSYGLLFTGPPLIRFYRDNSELKKTLKELQLNGVHLRAQLRL